MINYDGCSASVDGGRIDLIRGVERILEEIAYKEKTDVWSVYKDLTVMIIKRELYKEYED